jgi:hypothetical protein
MSVHLEGRRVRLPDELGLGVNKAVIILRRNAMCDLL